MLVKHIRSLITVLLAGLSFLTTFSQQEFDAEKIYYEAEYLEKEANFKQALDYYLQLPEHGKENANIHYKIGRCYMGIAGLRTKAVPYLEKAGSNISRKYKKESSFMEEHAPAEALLLLGEAYQLSEHLDDAIKKYKEWDELAGESQPGLAEKRIASCEYARDMLNRKNSIYSTKLNVSTEGESAYRAVISEDGNSLVFMKQRKHYQAVYYSTKKDGYWTKPVNITSNLQSDGNFLVCSLSPDGKLLLLSWHNSYDHELYSSSLEDGKWTKVKLLPKQVNSLSNEIHASIRGKDNALYFASDRKGGYGGYDIYRVAFKGDSLSRETAQAVNLGETINSEGDETSVFFTPAGEMCFASNGHKTMGGYDIFHSTDNSGSWENPIGFGAPLNTTDNNDFYSPAGSLSSGLSSDFDSIPGTRMSMYQWEIYDGGSPAGGQEPMALISFSPPQPASAGPPPATDSTTAGRSSTSTESKPAPAVEKANYKLNSILFAFDNWTLDTDAKDELKLLSEIMKLLPELRITISGHTDAIGPSEYNLILSGNRADAVKNRLIESGLDKARIKTKKLGEEEPVALNKTEDGKDCREGRKYNRRVSFTLEGPGNSRIEIIPTSAPSDLRLH